MIFVSLPAPLASSLEPRTVEMFENNDDPQDQNTEAEYARAAGGVKADGANKVPKTIFSKPLFSR